MCASIPLHRRNQRNGRKWLTLVVDRAQNHRQPQADVQIHWYNPLPISPHIEPCRTLLITLRGIEGHLGRYSTEMFLLVRRKSAFCRGIVMFASSANG